MEGHSYERVAPLLARKEQADDRLRCVFRCPSTGVTALSSAGLTGPDADGGLWSGLRRWVADLLGGVLGRGGGGGEADEAAVEAAVLRAFESVQGRFRWDGEAWRGDPDARLGAGFARQLEAAPVEAPRDREVLARLLVEIACADRQVTPEEASFLGEFLGSAAVVTELAQQPALTAAELKRAAPPVRRTQLLLAWTVALCDRDLAVTELSRLSLVAGHMDLPEQAVAELRGQAQELLLDRALTRAREDGAWVVQALQEARELAEAIGVEASELERAEAEVAGRTE